MVKSFTKSIKIAIISKRKGIIKMSFDRLLESIVEKQNPTAVGLDPALDYIPEFIKDEAFSKHGENFTGAAEAVIVFNKMIIDEIYTEVAAIKPQSAYFELLGYEGVRALYETIEYAKSKGLFVITDAKRNDIGSTMEAYAKAYLGETLLKTASVPAFGSDALTVNGYLGSDGIKPLLDICKANDCGIFVLAKTSNPSSGELQDRELDGKPVYEVMGEMIEGWGTAGKYGYTEVGAVVGATYPEQLNSLRDKLKNTLFLIPGYGAQGGGAEDVKYAFDRHGNGAVINAARSVMLAYKKEDCNPLDFAKAAKREVLRMKEEFLKVVGGKYELYPR